MYYIKLINYALINYNICIYNNNRKFYKYINKILKIIQI